MARRETRLMRQLEHDVRMDEQRELARLESGAVVVAVEPCMPTLVPTEDESAAIVFGGDGACEPVDQAAAVEQAAVSAAGGDAEPV